MLRRLVALAVVLQLSSVGAPVALAHGEAGAHACACGADCRCVELGPGARCQRAAPADPGTPRLEACTDTAISFIAPAFISPPEFSPDTATASTPLTAAATPLARTVAASLDPRPPRG